MFSVLTLCQPLDSSLNWCISQLLWPGSLATVKSPDLVILNPPTWYTGKKVVLLSWRYLQTSLKFLPSFLLSQEKGNSNIFCAIQSTWRVVHMSPSTEVKGHFMWFWQETGSGNLHNTYCYPVDVLVFHLKIFCWVKSRLGKRPVYPIYIIFQRRRKCSCSMAQLQNLCLPISSLILLTGQITIFPYWSPSEGI